MDFNHKKIILKWGTSDGFAHFNMGPWNLVYRHGVGTRRCVCDKLPRKIARYLDFLLFSWNVPLDSLEPWSISSVKLLLQVCKRWVPTSKYSAPHDLFIADCYLWFFHLIVFTGFDTVRLICISTQFDEKRNGITFDLQVKFTAQHYPNHPYATF